MIKNKNKEVIRGFSLVEIAVTIAIMAVLTAMLVPAILHYVEKSRMKKDEAAMSEVVKATNMTLSDDTALREWVNHALKDNLSCYLDVKSEKSLSDNKMGLTGNNKYRFDDEARIADEMAYYIGGNIDGVLITFEPNNKEFVISDALINKYAKNGYTNTLGDEELATAKSIISGMVGDKIQLKSRTYGNSEFTVFIQMDLDGSAHVVGEFNGTNIDPSSTTVPTDERKDNLPFEPFVPDIDFDVDPGHRHDWKIKEKVESTCTERGHITKHCFGCGKEETEELDLAPHKYDSGYQHDTTHHWKVCSVCGQESHREEHDTKRQENRVAPTCTQDGSVDLYCSKCGKLVVSKQVIKATGHTFPPKWEKANDQYHERKCTVCGTVERQPHVSDGKWYDVKGREADYECNHCKECGAEINLKLKEKWSNAVYTWTPANPNGGEAQCTAKITSNKNGVKTVSVNAVIDTKNPTCTSDGYYKYTATFAGTEASSWPGISTQTKTVSIPATGHKMGEWKEKDSVEHIRSCGNCDYTETAPHISDGKVYEVEGDSNKQCNHCSECGAEMNIVEKEKWSKATYTWDPELPNGSEKIVKCTATRTSSWGKTENVVVVAKHTKEDATCTTSGKHQYLADFSTSTARDWAKSQSKTVIINPKGHKMSNQWVKKDDKTHVQHCTRCDYVIEEKHHSDNKWYNVFGKEDTYKCNHCKECGAEINITEKWGPVTYEWSPKKPDGMSTDPVYCIARRSTILTHQNEEVVKVQATKESYTKPECAKKGSAKYVADFSNSDAINWEGIKNQEKNITIKELGHAFEEQWKYNDAKTHYRQCVRCPEKEMQPHTSADNKVYDASINPSKYECNHCDICGGEFNIREKWGTVQYTWTPEEPNGKEDSIKCTATRISADTGKTESVTVVAPRTKHKDPTCTELGSSTYSANFNESEAKDWAGIKAQEKTITISALGHNFPSTWIYLNDGKHYRQCTRCPEREVEDHVSDNIWADSKTNPNYRCHHCTICGGEINPEEKWAPYEYKWGPVDPYGTDEEIECTVTRYKIASHENVQSTTVRAKRVVYEEAAIPCVNHGKAQYVAKFSESEASTWEGIQDQTKDVEIALADHKFEQKFDNKNHWNQCSVCGLVKDTKEHVWPTEEKTIYKRKIMVDDVVYGETEKINKEHDGVISGKTTSHVDGSKMPTVNDQSNFGDDYEYTKRDGYVEVKIEGNWVVFEKYDGTEKTETIKTWEITNKGHGIKCKDCGFMVGPEEHQFEIIYDWGKDANGNPTKTCTAIKRCVGDSYFHKGCGYEEREGVEVKEENIVINKSPTCTEDGEAQYTAKFSYDWAEDQTIVVKMPKLGHNFSEKFETNPNNPSEHAHVCSRCGAVKDSEPHKLQYTIIDEINHQKACSICEYVDVEEEHVFQITYSWDGLECTANRICANVIENADGTTTQTPLCGFEQNITADASKNMEITASPNIENDGILTYTAKFETECDWKNVKNQIKEVKVGMPIIEAGFLRTNAKNLTGKLVFSNDIAPENADIQLNSDNTARAVWDGETFTVYSIYGGGVRAQEDSSNLFESFEAISIDLTGLITDRVTNMSHMFASAKMQEVIGLGGLNTENVNDMSYMFYDCKNIAMLDVSQLNTSNVKYMNSMFAGMKNIASIIFSKNEQVPDITDPNTPPIDQTNPDTQAPDQTNPEIITNQFTTKNVIDMGSMFQGCINISDLDISSFDTSKTINTASMFMRCQNLISIKGIDTLNVSKVTNMNTMFADCYSLGELDLSKWNTESLREMTAIFSRCATLSSLNIQNWKTGNVSDMSSVFESCELLQNIQGLEDIDTHSVTNMRNMFKSCKMFGSDNINVDPDGNPIFEEIEIVIKTNGDIWNVQNVTDMSHMFDSCEMLKNLNITGWETKNNTTFEMTFANCKELSSIIGFTDLDTDNATTLSGLFMNNAAMNTCDMVNFKTQKVTDMSGMLQGCALIKTIDLLPLNTDAVTNMNSMFSGCIDLVAIDNLNKINTANVQNMSSLFAGTELLTAIDLSNFNTASVTNMANMFDGALAVETLDLTSFNTSNVTNMENMFNNTQALKVIDMSTCDVLNANINNMFARPGANALDTVWCNLENINKLQTEGTAADRGNHAPEVFKLKEIWGTPTYQWDDETKVCTATKPCITFQERTIKVQGVSAKETIVNATCTSKGTDRYTATFPGYDWAETQIKDYETPMSPHKVNEAVFESDDTHHWNVCSECKQAINKTEHSVNISEFKHDENSHWNECSICHKKVNQKAHTWSEWEYDENTHQYHCNECGVVKGPESHIWSDVTYSWAGLKCTATRKCVGDHFGSKGCGYIQTETVDAEKNATIEKDSTCTEKGVTKYTADFTAAWANTQSKSITNIPVKEHNWSKNWISDKEQHWHECSECHQKQDAAQHNIVEDTKTKPGYIIKKCSVCGMIISEDPVVMNKMRFHTACQSLTGKITFSKDSAPSGGKDISEKQDGTVLLFIDGQNATIYSKDGGGVFAPTDRKLFQDMNMSELDLSGLNTSQITDMLGMFWSCQNLTTLDLSNLDTSNVTDMSYMFIFCSNIKVLDMSNFNTSKVTTMRNMFQGCSGLTSLNVSSFDTTNVTDMSNMFFNCRGLTSLNISNFNTSKTKDMGGMFQKCSGLTSLDVTNFNTSNVIDMSYMFQVCNGLTSLDLSSFDTSKVVDSKNMDEMLSDCNALTTVKCRTQEDIKKIKASKTCPKTINFIL